jgi:hypothetical protein
MHGAPCPGAWASGRHVCTPHSPSLAFEGWSGQHCTVHMVSNHAAWKLAATCRVGLVLVTLTSDVVIDMRVANLIQCWAGPAASSQVVVTSSCLQGAANIQQW